MAIDPRRQLYEKIGPLRYVWWSARVSLWLFLFKRCRLPVPSSWFGF
jgi:hypothetical protein